ncbi:hypothetical protein DMJ13_17490 [halophilic archaeon]|nr:hypothetical protein DMJ13_17490 [halophilic archaeon]
MNNLHPQRRIQISHSTALIPAFALIIAATFTNIVRIPTAVGYLGVSAVLAVFAGIWLNDSRTLLPNDSLALGLFGTLATIFLLGLLVSLLNPSLGRIARTIVFTVGTAIILFALPRLIPRSAIEMAISRIAIVLLALGGIVAITDTYPAISGTSPKWLEATALPGLPMSIIPWVGILNSPNLLGAVCVLGAFAAATEYARTGTQESGLLAATLAVGSLSSASRTVLVALIAGSGVVGAYYLFDSHWMTASAISGLLVFTGIVSVIANVIPGPAAISGVQLWGRESLWGAAWEATMIRPFIGWGATDTAALVAPYVNDQWFAGRAIHNSYLRMFVMTGVVGGIVYVALCALSLWRASTSTRSLPDAVFVGMIVAVLVFQLFNAATIFGLSFRSLLYSLVIGYGLLER